LGINILEIKKPANNEYASGAAGSGYFAFDILIFNHLDIKNGFAEIFGKPILLLQNN